MSARAEDGPARLLPPEAAQALTRSLAGLGALALLVLALALLGALITYDPADPSLNVVGASTVSNLIGLPGAYAADLLLSVFGLAAFSLPLLALAWAWSLLRRHTVVRFWRKALAVIPTLLGFAFAFAALPEPGGWTVPVSLGGALGGLALEGFAGLTGIAPWMIGVGMSIMGFAGFIYALSLSKAEWKMLGRRLSWLVGADRDITLDVAPTVPKRRRTREPFRFFRARTPKPAPALRREPVLNDEDDGYATTDLPASNDDGEEDFEDVLPLVAPLGDDRAEPDPAPRRQKIAVEAPKAKPRTSRKGKQIGQRKLDFGTGRGRYETPPLDLLSEADHEAVDATLTKESLEQNARLLEGVLQDFGIKGEIVKVRPGPVVTRYELDPAPGTKTSRVVGLADDIARSMSAVSVRVAVVPGSSTIGIELPNKTRETVYLRELLASQAYDKASGRLPIILGKDISGAPQIADLAKMPHLLIAGTTGSGKSVGLNAMILSLLYRLDPAQCKLILIDPKMLELSVYDDIPHLLTPVVTDPKKAVVALKWAVREMENRYKSMSRLGVRNIDGFNARILEARKTGEVLTRRVQTGFDPDTGQPIHEEQPFDLNPLPTIVVVVDEMADLMLVAGKEVEGAIQRLAQMARAAGIHIIMATQRPSVDVITGTIKANFPTRISFHVTSKIDSRTILGEQGAEQLLGQGDMLFMAHGGRIARVHGPFVSDEEVEEVVAFVKTQGQPQYQSEITEEDDEQSFEPGESSGDELYDRAVAIVADTGKASTSFVQRQLQIGYNRAARIIEQMEAQGVVSEANHVGKREVLIGRGNAA